MPVLPVSHYYLKNIHATGEYSITPLNRAFIKGITTQFKTSNMLFLWYRTVELVFMSMNNSLSQKEKPEMSDSNL